MKEVELFRIMHSDQSPECHMYLREKSGGRCFPVIIAMNEMAEIHRKVHGIVTRRPMTHDIFAALMRELHAELVSVEITELKEDVFYARMNFRTQDGREFQLDARPSDAVAVASGVGARLYAAESILEQIGIREGDAEGDAAGDAEEGQAQA
jgi:uncharacterized protein